MKKKILVIFLFILLAIPSLTVNAKSDNYENEYPYDTFTVDYEGNLTYTQTAYTPVGVLNRNDELSAPEDLYIKDNFVYVADTGNHRVVVFNYSGEIVRIIGEGELVSPTGVFVSDENYLYVADKGNQLVFKYSLEGDFIRTFSRPTEPLFGSSSPFIPLKVVVGRGENIYIIGDGSTSGVIQLNYDGSFLGYFGVNLSSKSLVEKIADLFVTQGSYASNTPPSPTNIALNDQSLVYTSTPNTIEALKKLDVNGNNILTTVNYNEQQNVVDLSVNQDGYLYAIYDDGLIAEYDPNGNLLFAFDVVSSVSNVLGLIQTPSAIAVDEYQNLFVIDMGRSEIITYQPSNFSLLVHQAIDLYNEGNYTDSTALFEEILYQNDNFALAHSALGKAYYQAGDYSSALVEYQKASDISGYSETYWKIRDLWLKDHLTTIFILILTFSVLSFTVKQLNKKTTVFAAFNKQVSQFKQRPFVKKITLLSYMMKHPIDASYQIKREHRTDNYTSTGILVFVFTLYLLYLGYAGFIFNTGASSVHFGLEVAKFFGVILLFVFSNYLVSTLFDGEGWLRDIFRTVTYALAPILIYLPFYILLTNVLTLNETILLQIFGFFMISYTLILIFIGVKEIHNYEIMETFKNLLLTIFTMLIICLIGFIIYVFGSQLLDFIMSWLKEVFFRVF
ncbi:MAG: YIP1 family protein [Candidatus Izemoplasmatales bacterium]